MSFCPSVLTEELGYHWTDFYKICYLSIFRKFVRITGTLPEHQYTLLIISRSILLKMRNVPDKSCRGNQNTILYSIYFFSEKTCHLGDNVANAHCMMYTEGYKYTLTKCNTYCFPTATTVARTRLDIMFYVHCLSCYVNNRIVLTVLIKTKEYKT